MSPQISKTPKFRRPPVIETVLGVQFEPLHAMQITHFGLFWSRIKDRFPQVEHHPLLEPVRESFDKRLVQGGPRWRIAGRPEPPRVWYLSQENEQGQQLLQVQPDRFLQNWRRASLSSQDYPSYERNREDFAKSFREFVRFAEACSLGRVAPNQCEVTYVNHIPIDDDCGVGEMFRRCFPSLAGAHSDDFLPSSPERVAFKCSYPISDQRGRLHIDIKSAMDKRDRHEILVLVLTARGAPTSTDLDGVLDWFDLGHFWVVKGFKSFTTKVMHERWEVYTS